MPPGRPTAEPAAYGGSMTSDGSERAGRVFRAVNVLHSMVYFSPEGDEEYVAAGLRPGRMGYFASRSAPMGAVGPEVVTATFYNFNVELVSRHIPRAWTLASPEQVLSARWRVADRTLRRLLGDEVIGSDEFAHATELLREVAGRCGIDGRPLFAGHAGLPWPTETHLVFWHAVTLIREHRGDGHIAVLVNADLSGLEALVTHTATGRGFLEPAAKALRMWSDEQWTAAQDRLRDRGMLDGEGALTDAGTRLRAGIESATDRLSAAPWHGVDPVVVDGLVSYGKSLTRRVIAAGALPDGVFAN
jgi:hypothetical protein